ncbi:hypothetical protein OV760_30105, partial [Salmonella enterica subsp. enterica serovar 1,4,[5],12:i:-]|nr:hypothetical protein [Salmonella enterica subsp. enterica serovar 1,4,[5],12:i:-]
MNEFTGVMIISTGLQCMFSSSLTDLVSSTTLSQDHQGCGHSMAALVLHCNQQSRRMQPTE